MAFAGNCSFCHSAPTAGVASWGKIDLYDAGEDGYADRDGTAHFSDLNSFIATYMPSAGSPVSQSDADNIVAYLTHTVDVDRNWCPGSDWPPADSSSSGSSSSSSSSSGAATAWNLEVIDDCGASAEDTAADEIVFFNSNTNNISNGAWVKDGQPSELSGASQRSDYNIPAIQAQADSSCSGVSTHTGTWLKRFVNFDGQHFNGSKLAIGESFGAIDEIVIELKVNTSKTDIPTPSELASNYSDVLTPEQTQELDAGKVAFGITFYDISDDFNDADTTRGWVYLEIDQEQYGDQWLRVTVPVENMLFFKGPEYDKTLLTYEEVQDIQIQSMLFNPETRGNNPDRYGNVVRNFEMYYDDAVWAEVNPKPTEDFKEMNVSIKKFEVKLK